MIDVAAIEQAGSLSRPWVDNFQECSEDLPKTFDRVMEA